MPLEAFSQANLLASKIDAQDLNIVGYTDADAATAAGLPQVTTLAPAQARSKQDSIAVGATTTIDGRELTAGLWYWPKDFTAAGVGDLVKLPAESGDELPWSHFTGSQPVASDFILNTGGNAEIVNEITYKIYTFDEATGDRTSTEHTLAPQEITLADIKAQIDPWATNPTSQPIGVIADATGLRYVAATSGTLAQLYEPASELGIGFIRSDGTTITRVTPYFVDSSPYSYVNAAVGSTQITPYQTEYGIQFRTPDLRVSHARIWLSQAYGSLSANTLEIAAQDNISLLYSLGPLGLGEAGARTEIDPTQYDQDSAGTLAAVGASQWSVQLIAYDLAVMRFRAFYGRSVFNSYEELTNNLDKIQKDFIDMTSRVEIVRYFLGALALRGDCTNLNDKTTARWAAADKFGSVSFNFGAANKLNSLGAVDTRAIDPSTLPPITKSPYKVLVATEPQGPGVGAFAGNTNAIATTVDNGANWTFYTPTSGDYVTVTDFGSGEDPALYFSSAQDSWIGTVEQTVDVPVLDHIEIKVRSGSTNWNSTVAITFYNKYGVAYPPDRFRFTSNWRRWAGGTPTDGPNYNNVKYSGSIQLGHNKDGVVYFYWDADDTLAQGLSRIDYAGYSGADSDGAISIKFTGGANAVSFPNKGAIVTTDFTSRYASFNRWPTIQATLNEDVTVLSGQEPSFIHLNGNVDGGTGQPYTTTWDVRTAGDGEYHHAIAFQIDQQVEILGATTILEEGQAIASPVPVRAGEVVLMHHTLNGASRFVNVVRHSAPQSTTGQYEGNSATYAGLPPIPADASATVRYHAWLTEDDIGTGDADNPQYPAGQYVPDAAGTSWVLAFRLQASVANLLDAYLSPAHANHDEYGLTSMRQMLMVSRTARRYLNDTTAPSSSPFNWDTFNGQGLVLVTVESSANHTNGPNNLVMGWEGFVSGTFSDDGQNGRIFAFISDGPSSSAGFYVRRLLGGTWGNWMPFSQEQWITTSATPFRASNGSQIRISDNHILELNNTGTNGAIRVVPATDWSNVPTIVATQGHTVQGQPSSGTQEVVFLFVNGTWEAKRVEGAVAQAIETYVDTGGNTDYRPFIPIHAPIKEMRITFGDRRYAARDQLVIFTGKELASGKSGWTVTSPNQWKLFSITGWNMGGDGGYYNWDMYMQSEAGYMHFSFQDTHNNQRNAYGAIKRIEVDYELTR